MYYKDILDIVNMGIVVIDKDFIVHDWNRWMIVFSKIEKKEICGSSLFNSFPELDNPSFLRVCKSVFTFGNIIYLSHKIHNYLFPFKVIGSFASQFEFMQQSCNIAPLKNTEGEIDKLVISVQDVTEAVIIENKLRILNSTDELTGASNRRDLEARLKEEFFRLKRYDISLSLFMFDIDSFKRLNDTHGHLFGDYILKELTLQIKKLIRDVDVLVRYGGDEFICMLPETEAEGAMVLAERIRIRTSETRYTLGENENSITLSIGVVQAHKSMSDPLELLEAADKALYQSKEEGKNRVSLWSPS